MPVGIMYFKLLDAGKFVKQGQVLRAKAQLEQLQTEIASVARKTGISSATKLALIAPSKELFDDSIPTVEWWDAAVLVQKRFVEHLLKTQHCCRACVFNNTN